MNEHNALLKKSRMTRYFIDAVITLSDDIPVDAITLRQVAAAAGYNSATLYNYCLLYTSSAELNTAWASIKAFSTRAQLACVYASGSKVSASAIAVSKA